MTKMSRIVNTILTISQEPGISAGELAVKLGISERSVYRYLRELKKAGYPVKFIKDPETNLRKHYLTPLNLTAAEALAIVAAGQSFLSQEGLPFCVDLETALIKVKSAICSLEERRTFYRMEPRFTYLSEKNRDYTPWQELIQKILECINRCRTMKVAYNSFSSDKLTERFIDPYDFYWSDGNFYLAAYCHKHNEMRSFRIDRFEPIIKIEGPFNRDPEFNLNEYLSSSWRVYRGSKDVVKVKILVYPPAARLFRETRYHETQEIKELEDGKLHCTFEVTDTPEFRTWLLGWGSRVEVVEPAELREGIKEELQESLGRYEK